MVRVIFILFISLLCFVGLMFYLLTWPWFVTRVTKEVINAYHKDLTIKDFTINKIHLDKNGFISIEGIRFDVDHVKAGPWQGQIELLTADNLNTFFGPEKRVEVSVPRLDVQGEKIQVEGGTVQGIIALEADKRRQTILQGDFHAASVRTTNGVFSLVDAAFDRRNRQFRVDPWRVNWMGGVVTGQLTMAQNEYTIHIDVLQTDLSEMAQMNAALLGGARGRLDGVIDIKGDAQEVRSLSGFFSVPAGAEVRAALLEPILAYIPASTQKDVLSRLIADNTNVLLDEANARFKTMKNGSLNFYTHLTSQKLNLNMGITIDLNVEGGLKNMLSRLRQFSSL